MDRRPLYCFALLTRATLVQGFSSFDMNCTIPDRTYDYVQGPNTRGSLQIVWSCLATLIACTYTVLHLNIPEQRAGRDGGYSPYLRTWWKRGNPNIVRMALVTSAIAYPWSEATGPHTTPTLRMLAPTDTNETERYWTLRQFACEVKWWWIANHDTAVWFAIIMLAPEWYAYQAVHQNRSASGYKAIFERLPLNLHPAYGWAMTHIYFAEMGGFVVRSNTKSASPSDTHLTPISLLQLLQDNYIPVAFESLPSKEELQDRSKSDALAKPVVVLQIVWFVANCVARLVKGLLTTQLEISILGTAVCSLISYFALFEKPRNIETTVAVISFKGTIPNHITEILQSDDHMRRLRGTIFNEPHSENLPGTTAILSFVLLATVLGAFHIAAWNFAFPTTTDRLIWRVNSVLTCALVLAIFSAMIIFALFRGEYLCFPLSHIDWEYVSPKFHYGLRVLTMSMYIISRMILAVLMIRFLFYITPETFLASWADNLPHI